MVPPARPRLGQKEVAKIIARHKVTDPVVLVGIRGYYLNSMGVPGVNDRGLYDDAIFLVSPTAFATFNANTDPSIFSPGIATLVPGVHRYRKGRHGISRGAGYPALRPATKGEELPVTRDGRSGTTTGIALNIHKGSRTSTSSRGCQTIHPSQWDAFIKLVYLEMDRHEQSTIPYVLTTA